VLGGQLGQAHRARGGVLNHEFPFFARRDFPRRSGP